MTRPVVFSASSVNSYQNCHLQWYFTYVLAEPSVQSEPQRVGIAVHDAAELYLKGTIARTSVVHVEPTLRLLEHIFRDEILPTYETPVLIEATFQIEVNGIPFSGVIDSVDRRHIGPLPEVDWDSEGRELMIETEFDVNILRDLKTTGSRPAPGKYRFAMTGYWLGATDLGYEPDAAQLDYIVRTKTPYYWPEVMDPITDDDISIFAATLESVAGGVARADYEPTGLGSSWACKSCGYRDICGPYQRFMEVTQ